MKKVNKIFIVTLALILSIINVSASTETVGTFTVNYGKEYAELNHGFITKNLSVAEAEMNGDICTETKTDECYARYKITGAYRQGNEKDDDFTSTIFYVAKKGQLTKSTNSVNTVSKSFYLIWKNAVVMSDGSKANLKLTLEGFDVNTPFDIPADKEIVMPIMRGDTFVELISSDLSTIVPTADNTSIKAGIIQQYVGSKYKFKLEVIRDGVASNYFDNKYLGFGFTDLDIHDRTSTDTSGTAFHLKDDKGNYSAETIYSTQYKGPYSEGIELSSSFIEPIYLAEKQGDTPSTTKTYLSVKAENNYLRIYPNGDVYSNSAFDSQNYMDADTFYSGFITSAPMKSFEFNWTGSYCGTKLFQTTTVNIEQTHTEGGEVYIDDYFGSDKYLEKEETNEHLVGSEPIYICKPNDGYYAKSVTVNGKAIEVTPDCKYQFDPLKFLPLLGEGQKYTIHVEFAKKPTTPVVNPKTGIAAITGIVGLAIIAGATVYIKKNKYAE